MVNTNPHSHKVTVSHGDDPSFSYYFVNYGDTTILVTKLPVLRKWRLRRAIQRAIKKHDLGSTSLSSTTSAGRAADSVMSSMSEFQPDQWASESQKGM